MSFLKSYHCQLVIGGLLLHTEDPPKDVALDEPNESVVRHVHQKEAAALRNFKHPTTILLDNRKLNRLEWNFRWLQWLVKLHLIDSLPLDVLRQNIGNLPSLQDLYPPLSSALDLPSLRSVGLSKCKKPSEELPEHHPSPFEGDNLVLKENFPRLEDIIKENIPLLDSSISSHEKLENLPIQAILKRCKESLKLGKRFAIVVRYNPVSKELGPLDIIFDPPSSINTLAFTKRMRMKGWENIFIWPELPVALVYLTKEAPLQTIKHFVFLVYHGPDVSKAFIHNLFESLSAGGVKALDIDLNKWELDREKCLNLEQGSKRTDIHIPIVSRHCADSFLRHLGELLRICRSNSLIRPLFYGVEPADVYDMKDLYKRAFSMVATLDFSSSSEVNEVFSPRKGLPQLSFHTGWSLASYRNVEQLVRRVVFDNLQMVSNLPFHAVGLEEHLRDLMGILKMESDDKVTVGICGTGGIGKTSLAKAVFNRIFFRFQACSFVADVKRHDICKIQEQVLRDLVGSGIFVKNFEHGKALVKANVGSIRALVILDDINSPRQLEAFSVDWLAPGSRVILTSRDDQLFSYGQTDVIYYIDELSYNHGIELFSWHAFLRKHPHNDYKGWSQRIVKACHGIPLLLEIVGAFLYGKKDDKPWESSTKCLENPMDQEIHSRLRFSYLDLDPCERQIFLDIACFFNGNGNLETTSTYWEAIGFAPKTALENLVLKSLITIDDQNQLVIHDYVQEMGRAIVAEESPKLEKRRRIWKPEEAIQLTSRCLGTASIQSISICRVEGSNIIVKAESLALMRDLKLLWMDGLMVEGDYQKISPNLIWLRWNPCPLKSFPSEWPIEHTVVLDLSSVAGGPPTELQSLWNESSFSKKFVNLRVLRLNYAPYLEKLPDFSNMVSLLMLDLERCYSLRKLPSSIECLGALKCLNLSWCRNLVELPHGFSRLSSLERLSLRHCSSLKELPSEIEELMALKELDAGFSQRVDKLPSFQKLPRLEKLILTGCWSIRVLPQRIGELYNLKELDIHSLGLIQELPSLDKLSFLKKLVLNDCSSLTDLPSSIGKLRCLEYLDMNGCSSIRCLPNEFGNLVRLEKLYISNCPKLSTLPGSFGNLVSLRTLELKHNSNLMGLPLSFSGLQSLLWFDASNCNLLDGLPRHIGDLLKLQLVNLENNQFHDLPLSIDRLGFLRELNLSKCQSLETIPTLPRGLVKLDAGDCTQLKTIYDMSGLETLKILILCNCGNLIRLPDLKSCQSLVMLNISRCRKVRSLAGAEGLSSLKTLYLSGSGVSVSVLRQGIKDMPYLQEVSIYANEVPQWLEHKSRDQYLHDENFTDILISPVKKTTNCRGVLLCFVLNFMYKFRSVGSPPNCMKMSIRGDDGEAFWTTVFSNRQKVEGDQLYICLYGENHTLTRKLGNIDRLRVMAKGTNIQIKECGMQLLYNGIGDLNLGRLEDDLSSLVANYNDKSVTDKVAANETEFPHKIIDEEDDDIFDYGYSTSEDEYFSNEEWGP